MPDEKTKAAKGGGPHILLADEPDMTLTSTRVFVLTSLGGPETHNRFSEAGVRYLEKPLGSSPLRAWIRDLMGLFTAPKPGSSSGQEEP